MKGPEMPLLPAVIFSGGSEIVSVAIAEALAPAGVPLVVISLGQESILKDVESVMAYCEVTWPPPSLKAGVDQVNDFLNKIGASYPRPWPTFATEDGSLRFLIEAREAMSSHLAIAPGAPHLPNRGLDKAELFQFLAAEGHEEILAPTIPLRSLEEAAQAAERFEYNLVFKPSMKPLSMEMGPLKAKALAISRSSESAAVLRQLALAWPIADTWVAQRKLRPGPMGEGVWYGIRTAPGFLLGLTAVERWKYPSFGGTACWVQTASIPILHGHAALILNSLGYEGIAELAFLQDGSGRWRLLELNARPWLQAALATRAGVPLIRYQYEILSGSHFTVFGKKPVDGVSWVNVERMLLAAVSDTAASPANKIRRFARALNIIVKSSYKAVYDTPLKGVKVRWLRRLLHEIPRRR